MTVCFRSPLIACSRNSYLGFWLEPHVPSYSEAATCPLQLQGFAGRAATTTIHDATETGVSISGIFQAAEDFAVLGWWNAYDYFNHLRLKHLPKTDLSGLKLEFDIEYDQTLDGAIRLDAAKYPSVSWDAMTFVTGAGDSHDVRLLDHATVVSGSETAATVLIDISGDENMDGGIDWLHLYFRDTRYTVTSTDCRVETQLTAAVKAGDVSLPVEQHGGLLRPRMASGSNDPAPTRSRPP